MMEVVYRVRLDHEAGGITKTCAEGITETIIALDFSADPITFSASGVHDYEQHLQA